MPQGGWPNVTRAAKWGAESDEDLGPRPVWPAVLIPALSLRVLRAARPAGATLARSQGYRRVDLRITESGEVYVLEVTPDPDLSSDAGLTRMAQARGWQYGELIMRVVEEALQRYESARAAEAITQNVPA